MKILLQGYYGFGNLGDDLLLKTSFRLIRNFYQGAEIHVLSNNENMDYISKFLQMEIKVINYQTSYTYDLIVHGGGGVHFDYTKGDVISWLAIRISEVIGLGTIIIFKKWLRGLRKRPKINSKKRIGLGIGIGTYSKNSRKYLHHMEVIRDYDYLFVRDPDSLNNLKKYSFEGKAILASDLVFLDTSIHPSTTKKNAINKIGVILRDWEYDNHLHIDNFFDHVDKLTKDYTIKYISFDVNDIYFRRTIEPQSDKLLYDPLKDNLTQIISELQKVDLIITSRAHGAYLGCCLGIPSICLNIEPKLVSVHKTLSKSSVLLNPIFSYEELGTTLTDINKNYHLFYSGSKMDLEENRKKAENIVEFLTSYSKSDIR